MKNYKRKFKIKMTIKKIFQKRFISIVLTGMFLIVSITGILMFFMIESFSMNKVHAWVGMGFVIVCAYHLIKNFTSFKSYLKYPSSSIILILILIGSIWYIKPIDNKLISPKKEMMKAIFTQPILKIGIFFKKDIDKVIVNMKSKGIDIRDSNQTLMQIAKDNNKNIKKLFFIFFEKSNDT